LDKDIGPILNGWPHDPGEISVRKVRGLDGRPKIQLRLDLGLLQMETRGRPDGTRPHDCESLLEHLEKRLSAHQRSHGSEEGFTIEADYCRQLRAEAVQYYYRYLSEFVLEDYQGVVRDTARNLRVLDLVQQYAAEEADRQSMEQYRPYILMMHTRARAHVALSVGKPDAARRAVHRGLAGLRELFSRHGDEEQLYRGSPEAATLEALLGEIESSIPPDPLQQLKRELARAVEEERYEDAARLRDSIAKTGPKKKES